MKPNRRGRRKKRKNRIPIEQIDIREVLDEIGVYYTEEGKNVSHGWIGTTCPFCSDESNHFGINLKSKTGACFKCGTKGSVITYLSEILNSFEKALDLLRRFVPREYKSFDDYEERRSVCVDLPKEASRKITPYHAGYLHDRNFDYNDLCDLYNLHFCGPIGKWSNRIIVPVTRNYQLITFTSVDISDEAVIRYKHLSAEESIIHVKEWLYGIEHTNGNSCVIVEGYFDMLRIGPGCLCNFGTKVTSEQKRMLAKFNKVVIAFDGDNAGRSGADNLANDLAVFTDVEVLDLPDGKDPDSLCEDDIKFIRSRIGK